jgi:hypothetical protein
MRDKLQITERNIDVFGLQIGAQRNQYEESWDEIDVAAGAHATPGQPLTDKLGNADWSKWPAATNCPHRQTGPKSPSR